MADPNSSFSNETNSLIPTNDSSNNDQQSINSDGTISSEEIDLPVSALIPHNNSNSVNANTNIPDARNGDDQNQSNQASKAFRYPVVLSLSDERNLPPGARKIIESRLNEMNIVDLMEFIKIKQEMVRELKEQFNKKDYQKRPLEDSVKDKASLPKIPRKLEANPGNKCNKDEKRPLQDFAEILPRNVRKPSWRNDVGPSPDTHSYLTRLSKDMETQIMLLTGMIEYHRRNGVYPFENVITLQDFINVVLELDIKPQDLRVEINRLFGWYALNQRNYESLAGGQRELFGLARRIWYREPEARPEVINEICINEAEDKTEGVDFCQIGDVGPMMMNNDVPLYDSNNEKEIQDSLEGHDSGKSGDDESIVE